jgi:hypothetical protein
MVERGVISADRWPRSARRYASGDVAGRRKEQAEATGGDQDGGPTKMGKGMEREQRVEETGWQGVLWVVGVVGGLFKCSLVVWFEGEG